MIKYKANIMFDLGIKKVECERESDHSVFFGKRNERKESQYHKYFDSFKEAQDFLIARLHRHIYFAKNKIENLEKDLAEIEALTE